MSATVSLNIVERDASVLAGSDDDPLTISFANLTTIALASLLKVAPEGALTSVITYVPCGTMYSPIPFSNRSSPSTR